MKVLSKAPLQRSREVTPSPGLPSADGRALSLVDDGQDRFSSSCSFRQLATIGLGGLCYRHYGIDETSQFTRIEQPSDFGQLLVIGFDNEKRFFDSFILGSFTVGGNGDHAAIRFQQTPGSSQGFTANQVENDIDLIQALLNIMSVIVEDLIGSKLGKELKIPRRSRGDDMNTRSSRQLNGKYADGTSSTMNKDPFARMKFGAIK